MLMPTLFHARDYRWLLSLLLLSCPFVLSVPVASGMTKAALVIGNAEYEQSKLKNPTNDARDMANTLRGLGFDVIHITNADRRTMLNALEDFGNKMSKDGVAFFFYAGHGVQIKGINYLLPLKETFKTAVDAEASGIKADYVLAKMEEAGSPMNIVVLDACRDNPFARSLARNVGGSGLAQMSSGGVGAYFSFATSPGKTAEDGESGNGLYTKHLLASLRQPGLNIEQVFKRTREGVITESNGEQVPWDHSSLRGDFYFIPATPPALASTATVADPEALFWQTALASNSPAYFQQYLAKYPEGTFAALARLKIEESTALPNRVDGLKRGMQGYVTPASLLVDSKGGLWVRQDAAVSKEANKDDVLVILEEGGIAVDISTTNHRWERSKSPSSGFIPVARLTKGSQNQPTKISTMSVGQKGWVEPAGMIVDATGGIWLRPDYEVSTASKARNSIQVERTSSGYVVNMSNTGYRWEKTQVVTAGALPVERLAK